MSQTSDLGLSALSTINREAFDKPSTRRFTELPRSPPESARNIHAKSRKRAKMMMMAAAAAVVVMMMAAVVVVVMAAVAAAAVAAVAAAGRRYA